MLTWYFRRILVAVLVLVGCLDQPSFAKAPPALNNLGGPAASKLRGMFNSNNASPTGAATKFAAPSQSAAPRPSSSGNGRLPFGVNTTSAGSKPFSSYQSAPTVSPYLNLFRDDFGGTKDFNYSTLVQPQLRQQQTNQQLQRQDLQTNRRLQALAAQADFNPQGNTEEAPTGHQTVFTYYGHYYRAPQTRQKRR